MQVTWDGDKTLNIEGEGKIDKNKWISFKNNNKLTTDAAKEVIISFGEKVQFPDDASNFFYEVKSKKIVFHPNMDTKNVTNMRAMFKWASNFDGKDSNIGKWDTSNVTTMQDMFQCKRDETCKFNGDLSKWNTSNVTTMRSMFQFATSFNGDLSKWDTKNVTDMSYMFGYTTAFQGKGV